MKANEMDAFGDIECPSLRLEGGAVWAVSSNDEVSFARWRCLLNPCKRVQSNIQPLVRDKPACCAEYECS